MSRRRNSRRKRGRRSGRVWVTVLLLVLIAVFGLSIYLGRIPGESSKAATPAAARNASLGLDPAPAPAPVPPLPPPIVPDADSPSLIIWNGCGRMGLGARAERWMRRLGFDVYETTNADRSDYPQTLLITRPGREEPAGEILRSLQERLRVGRLADKEVRLRDVDALLILGRDFPDSLPLR